MGRSFSRCGCLSAHTRLRPSFTRPRALFLTTRDSDVRPTLDARRSVVRHGSATLRTSSPLCPTFGKSWLARLRLRCPRTLRRLRPSRFTSRRRSSQRALGATNRNTIASRNVPLNSISRYARCRAVRNSPYVHGNGSRNGAARRSRHLLSSSLRPPLRRHTGARWPLLPARARRPQTFSHLMVQLGEILPIDFHIFGQIANFLIKLERHRNHHDDGNCHHDQNRHHQQGRIWQCAHLRLSHAYFHR